MVSIIKDTSHNNNSNNKFYNKNKMSMITIMFQFLIFCVYILYICVGVCIGLGWVKNLCDNTAIKNCWLPIIMFIAVMLIFFWLPIYIIAFIVKLVMLIVSKKKLNSKN